VQIFIGLEYSQKLYLHCSWNAIKVSIVVVISQISWYRNGSVQSPDRNSAVNSSRLKKCEINRAAGEFFSRLLKHKCTQLENEVSIVRDLYCGMVLLIKSNNKKFKWRLKKLGRTSRQTCKHFRFYQSTSEILLCEKCSKEVKVIFELLFKRSDY